MTFARDKYLNQLIKSKENGFPKVITGIRRCGKSYLLDKIYREWFYLIFFFSKLYILKHDKKTDYPV